MHLHQTLKRLLLESHLTDLFHKLSVDLEDARFDEIFHAEVIEPACFHLAHEVGIDLEDRRLEKIVYVEFAETSRVEIVCEGRGHIERCRRKQAVATLPIFVIRSLVKVE